MQRENEYLNLIKSSIQAATELKERLLSDEMIQSIDQSGKILLDAFIKWKKSFLLWKRGIRSRRPTSSSRVFN